MKPVALEEGQLVDWSPIMAARMLARGVELSGRRLKRSVILRKLMDVTRAWWAWTMAWPGEVFWDIQRDLLVQVASGVGSSRRVRVASGQALSYHMVRRMGLDAVWAITPVEPSPYTWHHLAPAPYWTERGDVTA